MILKYCLSTVLFLGILSKVNSQVCSSSGNYSQVALYTLSLKSTGPFCKEYNFGKFSSQSFISTNLYLSQLDCNVANIIFKNEKGATLINYCLTKLTNFIYNGSFITVSFILSNAGSINANLSISFTDTATLTTKAPPTTTTLSFSSSVSPVTTTASSTSTVSSSVSGVPPLQTKTVYYKNNSTCGQSVVPNDISDTGVRIVGGTVVKPNSYPWQVLITDGQYLCGASLINNQWLLTAAHCVTQDPTTAYFGVHDRRYMNYGTSISVQKMIPHELYNTDTLKNDIALYKLATPVQYSDIIRPICMPDRDYSQVGKNVIVTGWGKTTDYSSASTYLREVLIPIQLLESCNFGLDSRQICAGINAGSIKDSCQGDSGGPLISRESDKNQYVQDGVVSFGGQSCDGNGAYTNVYAYKSWIEKTIANN